jgi:hypothetical protein
LLLYLWLAGSCPDSHSGGATGFGIDGGALKAGLAGGGAGDGTKFLFCLLIAFLSYLKAT